MSVGPLTRKWKMEDRFVKLVWRQKNAELLSVATADCLLPSKRRVALLLLLLPIACCHCRLPLPIVTACLPTSGNHKLMQGPRDKGNA